MFIVIATLALIVIAIWSIEQGMSRGMLKLNRSAAGVLIVAVIVIGFVITLTIASAVSAQQTMQHCALRAKVIERLTTRHGETRRSMGLGSNNAVMEVFASDESGSWTITVTMTNGVTCLVASGQAFEELAEVLPPRGDAL